MPFIVLGMVDEAIVLGNWRWRAESLVWGGFRNCRSIGLGGLALRRESPGSGLRIYRPCKQQ